MSMVFEASAHELPADGRSTYWVRNRFALLLAGIAVMFGVYAIISMVGRMNKTDDTGANHTVN